MKKTALISSLLFALPFIAAAQALQPVANLVSSFGQIVQMIIPILVGLALVYFFYGLVKYIQHPDKGGKDIMIAGITALFVMVCIWGIVQFAQSALGINSTSVISAPHFQ